MHLHVHSVCVCACVCVCVCLDFQKRVIGKLCFIGIVF